MGRSGRRTLRVVTAAATFATVLAPSWWTPARTITIPMTKVRTVRGNAFGRAHFAFAPTHVAFSWTGTDGGAIAFRVHRLGTRAPRWRIAPEAHDLEWGNHHYSGVMEISAASAIQWRPVRRHHARIEGVTLDYLDTMHGPRRTVSIPAAARAAARTPDIVTRAEWGANESIKRTKGRCRRDFSPVQQLFVHHTAGSNYDPHPRATMRAIYWFHTIRRGWCDVGYNFVVSRGGTIFEGRWARGYDPWETHDSEGRHGDAVVGAHVEGYNTGSVGVSVMGNFSTSRVPKSVRAALVRVLAWEADRHNLNPTAHHTYHNPDSGLHRRLPVIAGHRDAGFTNCPGNNLYRALPSIRKRVKRTIGAGKLNTVLRLSASTPKVTFGDSAEFAGRLATRAGVGLPAHSLDVYRKPVSGRWSRVAAVRTGPDGRYSFSLNPAKNMKVVTVYRGNSATWESQSARAVVRVMPGVTLTSEGAVIDKAGIAHYPAGTRRITLSGEVTPAHPDRTVTVHVSELQPDGSYVELVRNRVSLNSESHYRYVFDVPTGSEGHAFRARAWFLADKDHATSPSNFVHFVIDPAP